MTTDSNSNSAIPNITRDGEEAGSGDLARENVERLKALFPQIVADGKVDFDALRQLLGDDVEDGEERYGLNWKGKRRARAFAMTPSLGTLRPAPEDSVDWDTTQNIMIEGDNLEVLKLLRRSYSGRVKLIYIDPPYNTGSDFVYPDDYSDSLSSYRQLVGDKDNAGVSLSTNKEASGRFHTDWLSMIYPRLILAAELLSDDGVLAISINEKEIGNLLTLIESESTFNQISAIHIWKNKSGGGNDSAQIVIDHEYVVLVAKTATPKIYSDSAGKATTSYSRSDENGRYSLERLDKQNLRYSAEADFVLIGPKGEEYHLEHKDPNQPNATWRWSKSKIKECFDELVFENGNVYTKNYEKDGVKPRSLLVDERFGRTRTGSSEVRDLLGSSVFDNPKPTNLLRHLIRIATTGNDIVMDFFAGSGSTGHAVMLENAEGGQERRFVLVQLPERLSSDDKDQRAAAEFCTKLGVPLHIAELTKERLRRAGKKVQKDSPEVGADTGFRVYKLSTSNLKSWQPDPDNLEASILDAVDNVLPDRSEDDLLVELLLKTGIDLTMQEEKREIAGQTVHALGGGALIVCLGNIADDQAEELGQGMADWVDELDPAQTTVYFKDSGIGSEGNRAATKANLAAILRQRLSDRIAKIASI